MAAAPPNAPAKPNVGRASAIMLASLFLSRVLGILRDSIMAAQFGRNHYTDAYFLAFQIPDLLFFLIAGGALSSAFIPVFSDYLHTDRRDEAWKVFSVVVTVMSVGLVVVIGLAWLFADPLVMLMNGQAKSDDFALIAHMSRIVLPTQYAFFIGGLMFGTLYAHQKFAIPGLGPNVYNLFIIFGALVISHFVSPGIVGLAWGALIGAFIGNLVIPLVAMRGLGAQFKIDFDVKHPGVVKVFKLMLPVVLGLSLPGVYAMIMKAFASHYPAGIVSSLDLGNKLMQAPLGLFGQSFAIAIFPALSQFFAQKQMDMYRDQLVRSLRVTLYITIPIAVLMGIMAKDIVTLLFGYGKFLQTDPSSVIDAVKIFSIGIPAWCLHPILMRGYFAMQQSVKPVILGTLTTALFVGLALSLQRTGLEWRALPVASSVSAIFLAFLMTITLTKDCGGLELDRILSGLAKCLVAVIPFGVIVWLGEQFLPEASAGLAKNVASGLRILMLFCVGGWVYYFITKKWGMQEASTVERGMARAQRLKR